MLTFSQVLDKFRSEAWSERDKGFRFERLMQAYLKTTSVYEGRFDDVWLWTEFPSIRRNWTSLSLRIFARRKPCLPAVIRTPSYL